MRGILHVGMAVDASEHTAVNGVFEGLRIDVQTTWLAVHVVGQSGIAVAGEALFRGWFRGSFGGCWLGRGEDAPID